MRYIKRFNEELDYSTYRRAANKAKAIGHVNRSNRLIDWSDVILKKKKAKDLERLMNELSKYPSFELIYVYGGKEFIGNFYLDLLVNKEYIRNDIHDFNHSDIKNILLYIDMGGVPADDDTLSRLIEFNKINDDNTSDNIVYGSWIKVNIIEDIDKDVVLEDMDNRELRFSNRRESLKFKKLINDAISGKNDFGSQYDEGGISTTIKDAFTENKGEYDGFDPDYYYGILKETLSRMSLNGLYID